MTELINEEELVRVRRRAEGAVADMADGEWKTVSFQTILSELVRHALVGAGHSVSSSVGRAATGKGARKSTGTTSRILGLIDEGFFSQPRSLGEIKETLAEKGFHYRLEDLGTPLTRLVQQRHLRRSQSTVRGKKIWLYANY